MLLLVSKEISQNRKYSQIYHFRFNNIDVDLAELKNKHGYDLYNFVYPDYDVSYYMDSWYIKLSQKYRLPMSVNELQELNERGQFVLLLIESISNYFKLQCAKIETI